MFRPTVTQIRVIVVSANLSITLLVGAMALNRIFSPHEPIDWKKVEMLSKVELEDFSPPKKATQNNRINPALRVKGLGVNFRRHEEPQIAEVPGAEEDTEDFMGDIEDEEEILDPEELPPGPLEEEWEYIGGIFDPFNAKSETNLANLVLKEKKRPKGAKSRKTARGKRKSQPNPYKKARKRGRVRGKGKQSDTKLLKVYQRWIVDEDKGPVIFVERITPEEFVYQEQGRYNVSYALKMKKTTIYGVNKDGDWKVVPIIEEEDGEGDEKDDDEEDKKEILFLIDKNFPTDREFFDERHKRYPDLFIDPDEEEEEETKPTRGSRAKSKSRGKSSKSFNPYEKIKKSSRNRSRKAKKPSAADIKELKKTLKGIPKDAQKEIQKAMRGGK